MTASRRTCMRGSHCAKRIIAHWSNAEPRRHSQPSRCPSASAAGCFPLSSFRLTWVCCCRSCSLSTCWAPRSCCLHCWRFSSTGENVYIGLWRPLCHMGDVARQTRGEEWVMEKADTRLLEEWKANLDLLKFYETLKQQRFAYFLTIQTAFLAIFALLAKEAIGVFSFVTLAALVLVPIAPLFISFYFMRLDARGRAFVDTANTKLLLIEDEWK